MDRSARHSPFPFFLVATLGIFLGIVYPFEVCGADFNALREAAADGRWEEVRTSARQLLQSDLPPGAASEASWLLARAGGPQAETIATLARIALESPETGPWVKDAHRQLVIVLSLNGQFNQALHQADAFLQRHGPFPQVDRLRSMSLTALGRGAPAENAWRQTLPDSPEETLWRTGDAAWQAGDRTKACALYETARATLETLPWSLRLRLARCGECGEFPDEEGLLATTYRRHCAP